mgnify:CR=1 FL=1
MKKLTFNKDGQRLFATGLHYQYAIQPENSKYRLYIRRLDKDKADDVIDFHAAIDALQYAQKHQDKLIAKLSPISDTVNWFKQAKPNPTAKNIYVQIGCHFEEVCEMLQAMNLTDTPAYLELKALSDEYKQLAKDCLNKDLERAIETWNKLALLDSLADQYVTSVGVGYMFGFDMQGAINEVNRSNYSKFENGKPIFDQNGKIAQGANYESPNLEPYL